jgi:hypothetical protein
MKSFRMLMLVPALLAAPLFVNHPASAAEWKFNVVNRGTHPALELRTQEEGEWSENWLESRLEPGKSIVLDFETDEGECTVRTQITFTDGSKFDANVNYCQVKTLTIYDDRLTGN